MRNNTIKILFSIWICCIILTQPNPSITFQNNRQIKSSDEEYTNITMEDVNDTLIFRCDSSHDIDSFEVWYIVNVTDNSSWRSDLGGMGAIDGEPFVSPKLQFLKIYKSVLLYYGDGGFLYNFWMNIYFTNPIDLDIFYVDYLEIEIPPPEIGEDDDNGDDDGDDDISGEEKEKLDLLWLIPICFAVTFVVYKLNKSKKKVIEFSINEITPNDEKTAKKARKGLEVWKKKFKKSHN